MKQKITTIINIQKIGENFLNEKLPIKTSYKLTKLLNNVEKDIAFYNQKLAEIIQSSAQKDSEGNFINDNGNYKIIPEKIEEVNNQLQELENLEIDTPDITFSIDEFEGTKLSVIEMNALMPFITEE